MYNPSLNQNTFCQLPLVCWRKTLKKDPRTSKETTRWTRGWVWSGIWIKKISEESTDTANPPWIARPWCRRNWIWQWWWCCICGWWTILREHCMYYVPINLKLEHALPPGFWLWELSRENSHFPWQKSTPKPHWKIHKQNWYINFIPTIIHLLKSSFYSHYLILFNHCRRLMKKMNKRLKHLCQKIPQLGEPLRMWSWKKLRTRRQK